MGDGSGYYLANLKDGLVPYTRFASAVDAQYFVQRLTQDDLKRSRFRALLAGLIDGNLPYLRSDLKRKNRSRDCNVNWGTARAYLESGSGAIYDLATQAPGLVSIETEFGDDENKRIEWNRTMAVAADLILKSDPAWDADDQTSQLEMTLYGTGPLLFEDEYKVLPVSVECSDLLVPDRSKSNTSLWEVCAVKRDYDPPDLYKYIVKEEAAEQAGWNVPFTKKVIQNAMDVKQPDSAFEPNWEFYQTELKSKSMNYIGGQEKFCRLAHIFFREFAHEDGREGGISHAIVERTQTGSTESGVEYLYFRHERFKTFDQCVHPRYWDRGRGGYHHNVTGLGVKQYGALEYQNRTLCNAANKTFAPKVFFRPASANAKEKAQLTMYEDYGIAPAGTEILQVPIQGYLADQIAFYNLTDGLTRSNLSQYRQTVEPEKPGNPATKFERQQRAAQESALSNTTFSRFYKQQDAFYTEYVRRLFNPNSTDERAKAAQKFCKLRGVPEAAMQRLRQVMAVRVLGGGTPFMRQQSLQSLAQFSVRWSDEGQQNYHDDLIAATVGNAGVARYNPRPMDKQLVSDQKDHAMLQVASAKIGIPPTVTGSQNPITHVGLFLKSAAQALESVQQGANPTEVLHFVDTLMPAAHAHLERIKTDPLSKATYKTFKQQFDRVAKLADDLKRKVQQMMKQRQQQQQKTGRVMNDEQIAQMQAAGEERRRNLKTRQQLVTNEAKQRRAERESRARIAMEDAKTAASINRQHASGFSE